MCGRSKCSATGSNVPEDESNYQYGAGALLGDLRRIEVMVMLRMPCKTGLRCWNANRYWSTRFGGSEGESQKLMQDCKYNMGQSEFKRKSVIRACMTIIH